MIFARSAMTGSSGSPRRKRRRVPRLLLGQPVACSYSHGFARDLALVSSSYLKMPDETVRETIELNLAMGRMGRVSQRTNSKGLRSFGTDRTRLEAF
jgi:hypothetical protein